MSCEGIRPLPDSICGMGKRRSTREIICARLPGYPTVHHPLQAPGNRDHPPYSRKFIRICSFKIWVHDVRAVSTSIAYYRNTPCLALGSFPWLLIAHHLHQCKLTLVVYQWLVGIFDSIMVNFLKGHTYRIFPPDLPPPSGELWIFCFLWLAIRNRNTD